MPITWASAAPREVAATQVRAAHERSVEPGMDVVWPRAIHVAVPHAAAAVAQATKQDPARPARTEAVVPVQRPPRLPDLVPSRRDRHAEATPTVQVTIGRVEIRAAVAAPAAPPSPRRAPAAKPSLSLADYLQRRSGGRP